MRIILISDTHLTEPATAFTANVQAAIDWIEAERPDLVVHLGDITADGANHPDQFAFARRVLSRISAPLLVLPGNHDIGDNPPHGGIKEPAYADARLAAFRASLGQDRWSTTGEGWTLLGLNAQVFGTGGAEEAVQAAWLEHTLAEAQGPLALFLHKPLMLESAVEDLVHSRFLPPEPRRALMRRLQNHDLRVIATGHVHQHRHRTIDGVLHLWAPSAAFIIPEPAQERLGRKQVGLVALDLDHAGPRARLVTPPGMTDVDVLDHPDIYPQVLQFRSKP